jgi:hypothetical protein
MEPPETLAGQDFGGLVQTVTPEPATLRNPRKLPLLAVLLDDAADKELTYTRDGATLDVHLICIHESGTLHCRNSLLM